MIRKPLPAVLCEFDGTGFTGNLWTRDGTAKTGVKMTDGVPHSDVIAFLNGYGTRGGTDLVSVATAANNSQIFQFQIDLNDDGRFFLYGSSLRWAYHHSGDHRELFGFTGHEQPTSSKITATNPWKRGNIEVVSLGGSYSKKGLYVMKSTTSYSALAQDKFGPTSVGRFTLRFSTNYMSQAEYDSLRVTGADLTVLKDSADGLWRVHTKAVAQNAYDVVVSAYGDTVGSPKVGTSFGTGGYYWYEGTRIDLLPVVRRVQNMTTWMRVRGVVNDADDIYDGKCLEDFDHTSGADISWTLNGEGKVVVSWYGYQLDPLSLTRTGTGSSLMRRLGFDGSEQAEALGEYGYDNYKLTANNVCPCVLPSYKPTVEFKRRVTGRIDQRIMTDGSAVSSGLRALNGWTMKLRVKGPIFGYAGDMERHLRSWWTYARRGLTVYPTFGDAENVEAGGADTRRHVDKRDVYDLDQRYTLFQTVEADDKEAHFLSRVGGRLLTRRSPTDSSFRSEAYDQDVDAFQEITLEMIDDQSR